MLITYEDVILDIHPAIAEKWPFSFPPIETGVRSKVEEYNLVKADNGRCFSWLEHNGDFYGEDINIVFSDGASFNIKDGSISTDQGGGKNMNLMWYFSGNDYKPGAKEFSPSMHEPGKGRASVFSTSGTCPSSFKVYYK